nr:MAG TPA: hypothetical protein [Caudoviricetes sp.]
MPAESPLRRLRGRGGATLPAKARQALRGPSAASEGVPPKAGPGGLGCAPDEGGPRAITQRRCCENPGTQNVSLVSFSEIGTKVPARATM